MHEASVIPRFSYKVTTQNKDKAPWNNSKTLFFCLVPDAGYGSHRRQYRRRNRRNNLHNPLKSFFLRHTLKILMVLALASVSLRRRAHRMGEG